MREEWSSDCTMVEEKGMDLSAGSLFASMVIGTVGFGLVMYGKKSQRWPQLVAGAAMIVYPYFVASVGWMVAIAAAIVAVLTLAVRAGL